MTKFYTPCFLPFLHPEQFQSVKSCMVQNSITTKMPYMGYVDCSPKNNLEETTLINDLEKIRQHNWLPMLSPDNKVIRSILQYAASSCL